MPKRTNDFQRLIAALVALLEDGVVVEESKLFPDPDTGEPREVDVFALVRGRWQQQEITVAVECVDHKRKMDVTWVEKMYGKHSVLQVADVVLLVSASGFSWTAKVKAERFGYRAITPVITQKGLAAELGLAAGLKMAAKVMMVKFSDLKFDGEAPAWAADFRWVEGEEHLYRADGSQLVKVEDFKLRAFTEAVGGPVGLMSDIEPSISTRSVDIAEPTYNGDRLHARLQSPDGETTIFAPVNNVRFTAFVEATNVAEMSQTELGEFDGHQFGTGTSIIDGRPARMAVRELPGGGFKAVARFRYEVKPDETGQG